MTSRTPLFVFQGQGLQQEGRGPNLGKEAGRGRHVHSPPAAGSEILN